MGGGRGGEGRGSKPPPPSSPSPPPSTPVTPPPPVPPSLYVSELVPGVGVPPLHPPSRLSVRLPPSGLRSAATARSVPAGDPGGGVCAGTHVRTDAVARGRMERRIDAAAWGTAACPPAGGPGGGGLSGGSTLTRQRSATSAGGAAARSESGRRFAGMHPHRPRPPPPARPRPAPFRHCTPLGRPRGECARGRPSGRLSAAFQVAATDAGTSRHYRAVTITASSLLQLASSRHLPPLLGAHISSWFCSLFRARALFLSLSPFSLSLSLSLSLSQSIYLCPCSCTRGA